MQKVTREAARRAKKEFSDALQGFVSRMQNFVSTDHGEWTVKGFIDIYRNIYTISIDTMIISKILEIHLFPRILQLAEEQRYSITEIIHVQELGDVTKLGSELPVRMVKGLRSITSVIKDFQFFVCEKWQLASDRRGSGNTANIGSITAIEDIVKGNGIFAKLGEDWFDEYWMNYGMLSIKRDNKVVPIRRLEDFVDFKGGNRGLIVPIRTKRRKEHTPRCES